MQVPFFGVSIKNLVAKRMASKIVASQKQYDDQVKALKVKHEEEKVTLADSIVNNIICK